MKFAVLCPGPSLTRLWPGHSLEYDRTIAVNRAALVCVHDYVMMMDNNHITADVVSKSKPKIGYLFPPHVNQHAWNTGLPNIDPRSLWPDRRLFKRVSLTGPGAMLCAANLGATEIGVFGNDMRGTVYFDGVPVNSDCDLRWQCEPRQWNRTVAYLTKLGVTCKFYRDYDGCLTVTNI